MNAFAESDGFRMAELVASISLATDLGTRQPVEHALRTLDYYCDYFDSCGSSVSRLLNVVRCPLIGVISLNSSS